jgi:two-component system cell cycle sensor histidine kinase/response regulator CckA
VQVLSRGVDVEKPGAIPRGAAAVWPDHPMDRRTVAVLQAVAVIAVAVLAMALVPWLRHGLISGRQAAGSVFSLALGVSSIALLRAGRYRAGVLALVGAVWAHVAGPMMILGLSHSLMGTRFAVMPLAAVALLLGRRELWGTFAAFSIAAAVGAARDAGWLDGGGPLPTLLPTSPLVSTLALFLLATLLLDRLAGSLRRALDDALRGNQALRERDEITSVLVDILPEATALIRLPDLTLVGCSPLLAARVGRTPGELLGQPVLELGLWEDRGALAAFLDRATQGEAVDNVEARARTADGSVATILASARALSLRGAPHLLTVSRNITDWKLAQEEQERMREQLRQSQKLEAVGRLAGGVAHDFNNILTSILATASLVVEGRPPGDPVRADLEQIRTDAHRAAELTRQLLTFARREVVTPRLLRVDERVGQMVRMLQRVLGDHVRLETQLTAGDALVRIDPVHLEQVLVNLAVNGRDAMPRGGRLVVGTSVSTGDRVLLSVRDEGVGIPGDVLPHVFEPFFTTKGPNKGTGLGLATCHGIVTQAGGEIRIESAPGSGTCVQVLLPMAEGTLAPEPPRDCGAAFGQETILVVDDQVQVRVAAARALRSRRYQVLEASSVASALEVAAAFPGTIDLALLDVGLQDGSGRDVADALRKVRPALRVLFSSGHTGDEVLRRGIEDAKVGYLPKPYEAEDLAYAVRQALDASDYPARPA